MQTGTRDRRAVPRMPLRSRPGRAGYRGPASMFIAPVVSFPGGIVEFWAVLCCAVFAAARFFGWELRHCLYCGGPCVCLFVCQSGGIASFFFSRMLPGLRSLFGC
ncbi:hypothetical protein B0T17DRAFT_539843 [Bombardia bombarda]|uniref:Uncharacterized protein n=1 Tax=Bombardia bombarda TaxID=252184 RepID=A0AA40BW70_9PEZI|nr:hypothetical protein B0T17DRAFT_539843 [Bombardia bombarda]